MTKENYYVIKVEVDDCQLDKLKNKVNEVSYGDVMPEQIFVSSFDEQADERDKY